MDVDASDLQVGAILFQSITARCRFGGSMRLKVKRSGNVMFLSMGPCMWQPQHGN